MPRKKSCQTGKAKNPAKKSGRKSSKPKKSSKKELFMSEQILQNSGISTRKMSARSLRNNFIEQFPDPSTLIKLRERMPTPPLMAAKNINKPPLRSSRNQSRDPKKLTSLKKEPISRRKASAKMATKTATNLSSVRKEMISKKPVKKSESKAIVDPLKAKIQKKLQEKKQNKKMTLAQKKKDNKKQMKYEVKALDRNAMKKIYSVEILPFKRIDVSHINPGIKTYGNYNSQRLASTVGEGEFDNELNSNANASIQPATSQRQSNEFNSGQPDTAVPVNQGVKRTRTAHCIHATDSSAIQENAIEQFANHDSPEITDEVQNYRRVNKNASHSGLKKTAVKSHQLRKKVQPCMTDEKLTTTLPEALASWLMDFYAKLRDPSDEEM